MNYQTAFALIREIFPANYSGVSDYWIGVAKKSEKPEVVVEAAREAWTGVRGFYDWVSNHTLILKWGSNPILWDTSVIAEQIVTGSVSLDEARAEFESSITEYFDRLNGRI